jgi:hypothetical protein
MLAYIHARAHTHTVNSICVVVPYSRLACDRAAPGCLRTVQVGFMVGRVTQRQVYLPALGPSLSVSFHQFPVPFQLSSSEPVEGSSVTVL